MATILLISARLKSIKTVPIATILFFLIFSFIGSERIVAQKNSGPKGNGNNKDIEIIACTEYIGNGLYRVTFGYDNPNSQEIVVSEEYTIVTKKDAKYDQGKHYGSGVKNFKQGYIKQAFTREFYKSEFVEWKLTLPNGKVKIAIVDSSSPECPSNEKGFIFPVYGQGVGKTDAKIDLALNSLAEGNAGDNPSKIIYQINNEKVLVEIVPQDGFMPNLINLLQNTYNLQFNSNPSISDFLIDPSTILSEGLSTVDIFFPINRLLELNTVSSVNFVRPLYPSLKNGGIVTSQGDQVQKTDVVKESFRVVEDGNIVPVNGKGIKVGVISDSFDKQPFTDKTKAQVDVENGDLPGIGNPNGFLNNVEVLMDFPYGEASDEGRAMLQIIHDVAPGADLAFHTGVISPRNFELAVKALKEADCSIIVDDITFPTEPFFDLGRIAQEINDFTSIEGNLYFTSAGNFANDGYQATFNSSTNLPQTNFLPVGSSTRAHVYGTNADGSQDVLQKISVEPGVYMMVLQWDESLASQENRAGAISDLDIYLVSDNGNLIVGNNKKNEEGDPTEVVVFQANASGSANIMITSTNGSGSSGLPFRLIVFRSQGFSFDEYGGAPTVSGHAMTPAANTIAAIDYRKALNPGPQEFSSYAGTLSSSFNLEIDLAAPDGVNTNVGSIGQDIEGDGFNNFFGTSAAAPHAAGAFALLMSAIPNWYPSGLPLDATVNTNLSADKALQLVKSTSTAAGAEFRAGAGLINMERAFAQIAAQSPKLTQLIVEDGKTPSAEPFEVTILGEFLPSEPKVLFDGKELEIVSVTESEIVAMVGVFSGNPALIVETEAKSESGTDKGISNGLTFFEDGKSALNISALNISAEFGRAVEFSFKVEGLREGETLESLGLPNIKFSTPAVFPYPDVNNYVISPSFESELTEAQKEIFQINFINGILEVTKKDLIIGPKDAQFTYGEPINLDLDYLYNSEGIEDDNNFLNYIKNSHSADFFDENTLIFINKFRAVVNEYDILNLLENGGWMSSERIIQNKFRAVVNGMNLIDLDLQHFQDYIDGSTDPNTNKFRAVVNKFRAVVNGEDLINSNIDLVVENKFRAVVNDTGLGGENDGNNYNFIFAVIDQEDGSTETEERAINKLYANHLITGLEVTSSDQFHYTFPGAYLSNAASNFYIKYESGKLRITPKTLVVETDDLEIKYGEDPTEFLSTNFSGFVYDETAETLFADGIPYYFIDKDGNSLSANEIKEIGVYEIKIEGTNNYNYAYGAGHGKLTVSKNTLTATSENLEINYGTLPFERIETTFSGFAFEEDFAKVFGSGIAYSFIDQNGNSYDIENFENIPGIGVYEIRIEETENYEIGYSESHGKLVVLPAELKARTNDVQINQGEEVVVENLSTTIEGFVFGQNQSIVFPEGLNYQFVNELGMPYQVGDVGIFAISITEPENYLITESSGNLLVSPSDNNLKNVRVYLECVDYNELETQGLNYKAKFKYFNPNDVSIYVLHGEDNLLTSEGIFKGQTPVIFSPGEGVFEIEFDGEKLYWSLTTINGTQKTSVSTEASLDSNKCDAKDSGSSDDSRYSIYPNPTEGPLTIERNVQATGKVEIYKLDGSMVWSTSFKKNDPSNILLDINSILPGMYYLKIIDSSGNYFYNLIKN